MNKGNTSMHKLKKRLGYLIYTYIPKQTVHIGLTLLSLKAIVQPKKKVKSRVVLIDRTCLRTQFLVIKTQDPDPYQMNTDPKACKKPPKIQYYGRYLETEKRGRVWLT
jgi:hypothetical protein